jgi:hypothetical protein
MEMEAAEEEVFCQDPGDRRRKKGGRYVRKESVERRERKNQEAAGRLPKVT